MFLRSISHQSLYRAQLKTRTAKEPPRGRARVGWFGEHRARCRS